MKRISVVTIALLGVATLATAFQKPSPPADTSTTIDGKNIVIHYSAPSMRGRKIFGGLEPYGKVWRAGANEATALHTDADLDMEGLKIPKGDYTLFVYLDQKQWKLIVSKATGEWGLDYDQSKDLGRVPMMMSKPPQPIETFKITLDHTGGDKGTLQMAWENTVATVPFTAK
ncbi:MAG: DUF2911 domain-containing protein [Bryobacteraceae bacterium]